MAKADLLNILYSKKKSPLEFKFDSLYMPPLINYITVEDRDKLYHLATSPRYASKINYKRNEIDRILRNRGFKYFHAGTNRVVYSYLEDQSFVLKVALDRVGMQDNPKEFRNQHLLKPFVTKMFDMDPSGTVATVERVQPITTIEEFALVAEDVFDLLNKFILGKYIVDDIGGTKSFCNYGLRNSYGPVLLDYPYVYELDGNKLICRQRLESGEICNGLIDYTDDFNYIHCTKCNKRYSAKELASQVKEKQVIVKESTCYNFDIKIHRGDEIIDLSDGIKESDIILPPQKKNTLNEF